VPARESGALTVLDARKGQVVIRGQVLGRVDDSDAQIRKVIADNELKVAEATAASDAELQAAVATIGVAKAEWEGSVRTRAMADNAISEYQVRRDKLTYDRSEYQAETARVEHEINQLTRGARMAQLEAVENEIQRRQIEAPIDGVVIDRFHNVGEWAQPGEPIYRVVHMDRLRVEGMISASDLTPEELTARPEITFYVKVPRTAENPRGEIELRAKIDFINQVVDQSGEFLISAEFDNPRKETGSTVQWAVRPGLEAEAVLDSELMRLMQQRRQQRAADSPRSTWDSLRAPASRNAN
jgi:multidrug efflux pump subunit AcrA (membrane-fusion protein)